MNIRIVVRERQDENPTLNVSIVRDGNGFFAMAVEQNKNKEKERGKRRRVFRGFNGVFLRGFGGGTPSTTPDRHAPTKKRAAKRARLCSGAAPKPFFCSVFLFSF